jgi:hypothetical protein
VSVVAALVVAGKEALRLFDGQIIDVLRIMHSGGIEAIIIDDIVGVGGDMGLKA